MYCIIKTRLALKARSSSRRVAQQPLTREYTKLKQIIQRAIYKSSAKFPRRRIRCAFLRSGMRLVFAVIRERVRARFDENSRYCARTVSYVPSFFAATVNINVMFAKGLDYMERGKEGVFVESQLRMDMY